MNMLMGKITGIGEQTEVTLHHGGKALSSVPTRDSDMGLEVNVGVRPEDLQPSGAESLYTAKVDYIEALGEVTLLYFSPQGDDPPVIAKIPGVHASLLGQQVGMTASMDKVHLFHKGESLLYR